MNNKQLFWVQVNAQNKITSISQDPANNNKAGWNEVVVNTKHADDFRANFRNYTYNPNGEVVDYPNAGTVDLKLPSIPASFAATNAQVAKNATSASQGIASNATQVQSLYGSANTEHKSLSTAIQNITTNSSDIQSLSGVNAKYISNLNSFMATNGSSINNINTIADKNKNLFSQSLSDLSNAVQKSEKADVTSLSDGTKNLSGKVDTNSANASNAVDNATKQFSKSVSSINTSLNGVSAAASASDSNALKSNSTNSSAISANSASASASFSSVADDLKSAKSDYTHLIITAFNQAESDRHARESIMQNEIDQISTAINGSNGDNKGGNTPKK